MERNEKLWTKERSSEELLLSLWGKRLELIN